ncbi:MAG: hypothetical protein AAF960_19095, partial [Bacteroidota bacterium]
LSTCKQDFDFPIEVTFKEIETIPPFQIITKQNGQQVDILPSNTQLDESPLWNKLSQEGIFASFVFTSETEAVYTFADNFTLNPKPTTFKYLYENNTLIFDTDFGAPRNTNLEIEGNPADFSIASEAVLIKNNRGRINFIPNFYRIGIDNYFHLISEGDTIVLQNYWQRYAK